MYFKLFNGFEVFFSDSQNANLLEQSIEKVLAKGYRTPDLMMGDQGRLCSTSEMTDKILEELEAVQ